MKNAKGFLLGIVIALGLAVTAAGFAQTVTQSEQKKEGASCCAMSCCTGDSCSMMKHDAKNNESKATSCCCGDSCSTMKHDQKHHESKDGCCCCGDSCSTMNHEPNKDANNHETANHEGCCCCGGDSCDTHMKEKNEKPKGD